MNSRSTEVQSNENRVLVEQSFGRKVSAFGDYRPKTTNALLTQAQSNDHSDKIRRFKINWRSTDVQSNDNLRENCDKLVVFEIT